MIRLKLSSVQSATEDTTFSIVAGESLRDAVERALKDIPLGDWSAPEVFTVVHNGHIIPAETWGLTKLSESDNILIAPTLKGGDESNIFRTVLMLAIVVVATVINPFAGGTVAAALFVAGVTIVGSLAVNALIPPSVPDAGGVGGPGYSYSDSQMYAITSQSNGTRKLQTVPKVYGTHRIFPNVAANPYTELQANDVGTFDQYFYAIYDFGLGPLNVSDIKIGDTPIEAYEDVQYFLVDPNKPEISEGPWDDTYVKEFTFFKGSSQSESFGVALDGNRDAGEAGYETIRNSAINTKNVSQSITLSLVNPRGLYGYATSGERGPRQIELQIYFAKVGTEDWHAFNDFDHVEEFLAIGGESQFDLTPIEGYYETTGDFSWLSLYKRIRVGPVEPPQGLKFEFTDPGYYIRTVDYGWGIGDTSIVLKNNPAIQPTSIITFNGRFVGRVTTIQYPVDKPGYVIVNLERPLQRNYVLMNIGESYPDPNTTKVTAVHARSYWGGIWNTQGAIYLGVGRPQIGRARIEGNTGEPVYSTFRFTPRALGQFKVKITRVSTASNFTYQVEDSLTFNNITTRFDTDPIVTDKRHVFMELKIRATNQLNGAISNLSAVCESILDVYNPETQTWEKQPTSSPPWVFADLLTGQVNKRAIAKSRLHLPSLLEWEEFCKEVPDAPVGYDFYRERFQTNFVLDFATTLQGILNQVANAAQASMNIVDGKYGVLVDRYRNVPVQIFTPRNSRDFGSNRVYTRRPDAVKVTYIDPESDWAVNETIVYDNGFDEINAVNFDELASFACTSQEQAWRYGRYMVAQNRLRQETISLTVDFEHLVCTRGDYVQIVQDVMKVGGFAARVKRMMGARVVIDDGIELVPNLDYGYQFRSTSDGTIHTGTLIPVLSDTFDLIGDLPSVGDLFIVGEVGFITYDCIIKSISPNDDLSASLTLVEKADEIYDAESTSTFTEYVPRLNKTTDPELTPPAEVEELVVLTNGYKCAGSGYEYFISIDWDTPLGSAPEAYEVYVDGGRGFNLVATTRDSQYYYVVNPGNLGIEHRFKILAVSSSGKKLDLGAVSYVGATPLFKTEKPQDVADLSIDITGEVLQLVWPQVDQCDIQEYLIRYSPSTDGTWEASIPLLRVNKNTTLAATQARRGVYLIKAVDFNGNQSTNARAAITTIPQLLNLNVIEEVDDFPALGGGKNLVVKDGDTLLLKEKTSGAVENIEYYSEGFYYYANLLDLGDIYSVRLQSLIQAEGIEAADLMSNWVTLAGVVALSNAGTADWDVQAQYRSTENLNVMAEWTTLSSVLALSEGAAEAWTPWRNFIMGDATGRIFQFRLRLISNRASVTPRVFSGVIRADMPDRIVSFDNLEAPTGGLVVTYDPAFYGPDPAPNLQVSIESAQSGDYWSFDYKTLEGFKIRFFDKNGNPVARTFDAVAKGYGRKFASVI
jgi:hypothetical protein